MEKNTAETDLSTLSDERIATIIAGHIGDVENIGIAILNINKKHLYFNDEYVRFFNLKPEMNRLNERLDKLFECLSKYGAPGRSVACDGIDVLDKKLRSGGHGRETGLIETEDGRTVEIKTALTNAGLLVLSLNDVTHAKQQKQLLDIAMDAGGAGYWLYSFETKKFTFSDSVRRRLSEAELNKIDTSGLWAIIDQRDIPGIMESWTESLKSGKSISLTYRVTTDRDGEMWQRSVGDVQYSSSGEMTHIIAFVTDISADVKKQKQLVSAQETSQAKTAFLARMSHEIKTPLNAIIGMADSLHEEDISLEARDTVEIISAAARNLNALLTQTLDHSKLVAEHVELDLVSSSPVPIVKETYDLWRAHCTARNIGLELDIEEGVPDTMMLDEFRLRQCLNNLLSNAIKFTTSGKISVSLKLLSGRRGTRLGLLVQDTGVGMTEAQCGKIFNAFEQADKSITRKFGGTGLGLSITKQLVELMGGKIFVKSQLGKGTVFAICLPISLDQPVEADKSEPQAIASNTELSVSESAFTGLSVLCVEDHPTNQAVVKKLIGKKVQNLVYANNGREALAHLQNQAFDIILMDIHMPVMDGIEATLKIRNSDASWANVIIIALTADTDYQHQRICRNLGMNDAIAKPVTRQDIFEAFDRTLNNISSRAGQSVRFNAA